MKRICYICKEEVDLKDTVRAQKLLDIIVLSDLPFYYGSILSEETELSEGEYLSEDDTELVSALTNLTDDYLVDGGHLHTNCLVDTIVNQLETWVPNGEGEEDAKLV